MPKYRIHSSSVFLRQARLSSRYCCYGNCTAGSKAI